MIYQTTFTYEQLIENIIHLDSTEFISQLKNWMTSGRMLWYCTGNISHTEAIALVESIRKIVILKPETVQDL
jgi:hypothetical protein